MRKLVNEQSRQVMKSTFLTIMVLAVLEASVALAELPDPGMQIDPANTALFVTDP